LGVLSSPSFQCYRNNELLESFAGLIPAKMIAMLDTHNKVCAVLSHSTLCLLWATIHGSNKGLVQFAELIERCERRCRKPRS